MTNSTTANKAGLLACLVFVLVAGGRATLSSEIVQPTLAWVIIAVAGFVTVVSGSLIWKDGDSR